MALVHEDHGMEQIVVVPPDRRKMIDLTFYNLLY